MTRTNYNTGRWKNRCSRRIERVGITQSVNIEKHSIPAFRRLFDLMVEAYGTQDIVFEYVGIKKGVLVRMGSGTLTRENAQKIMTAYQAMKQGSEK